MGMSLGINRGMALNSGGGVSARNDEYWNRDFLATGTWDEDGVWLDGILMGENDFLASGRWNRSGVWSDNAPIPIQYSLSKLLESGAGQYIIAAIGDSWMQGEIYWLRQFTKHMQDTYGNAGVGYVGFQWFGTSSGTWVDGGLQPSGGGAGTSRGDLVPPPVFDGVWSSDNGGQPGGTAAPSIGYAETTASSAYVRFTVPAGHNAADLFFVGTTAGGTVDYSWNGGASWETAIDISGTDGITGVVSLANVPTGAATLRLRRASGTIRICGVNLKSAASGVVVHKLGASGSNTTQWTNVDLAEWAEHLTTLGVKSAFILLGTNDASGSTLPATVGQNAAAMMAAITVENPAIYRLWIMPPERSSAPTTYPMAQYAAAVKAQSIRNSFDFLNLQDWWGSDPAAYAFGQPGALMDASNIHPATATGGVVNTNAVRNKVEPV